MNSSGQENRGSKQSTHLQMYFYEMIIDHCKNIISTTDLYYETETLKHL